MNTTTLKVFVKGNADVLDTVVSKADGGRKLDSGVRELVATQFPNTEVTVAHESSSGFAALRAELESGSSILIDERPQIVLLSLADDIREFGGDRVNTRDMVSTIEADLVAAIELIKERVGAHIFVASASTLDPAQTVFNYHDTDEEPISLRAHRLDLMVIGVSHDYGVSVIDVDRKIAELGGDEGVVAALEYSAAGCETITHEIVRVMDNYGFFDDRPLVEQIGAKAGNA